MATYSHCQVKWSCRGWFMLSSRASELLFFSCLISHPQMQIQWFQTTHSCFKEWTQMNMWTLKISKILKAMRTARLYATCDLAGLILELVISRWTAVGLKLMLWFGLWTGSHVVFCCYPCFVSVPLAVRLLLWDFVDVCVSYMCCIWYWD